MPTYRPTQQAYDAGHKLARQALYTADEQGGIAYPDTLGGFIALTVWMVQQFVLDGWLVLVEPPDAPAPALQETTPVSSSPVPDATASLQEDVPPARTHGRLRPPSVS